MFLWNLQKCLKVFDKVYVTSDDYGILKMSVLEGAEPIHRGKELCGDTPDIPVFQHAFSKMTDVDAIVAVHANNPGIEQNLITIIKKILEMGVPEVMTCYPMFRDNGYKSQGNPINGSIRGMTKERLESYGDPYSPNPEVLVVDSSLEIETIDDYKLALKE